MKRTPEYVEHEIYPVEDYRGDTEQIEPIPALWVKAPPVRYVTADRVAVSTFVISGNQGAITGSNVRPTLIVPACGNNQRVKATILARDTEIWLVNEDRTGFVTGVDTLPNGFRLTNGILFYYYGSAALYAHPRIATITEVDVILEYMERIPCHDS